MDRVIVTTVGIPRDEISINLQATLWHLEKLIEQLRNNDVVVTVRLVPHRPLRMGAYDTLIEVRRARRLAEPINRTQYTYHATPLMKKTKSA